MMDLEFLQKVMDTWEEVESKQSRDELQSLGKAIRQQWTSLVQEFDNMFRDEKYDEIRNRLNELKYVERIIEAIDEREMAML